MGGGPVRSSKAPYGQHTYVHVTLTLGNGSIRHYAWSTPMGLSQALHKAPAWGREELSREKVVGRSKIVACDVGARYEEGEFVEESDDSK
jgi:hypothetical protein